MTVPTQRLLESLQGLSERDATLIRRAVETLERNTVGPADKPWFPHRGIIPSFGTYEGVWNWDAAFHAIAVSRWDPQLAWEQLLIFLDHQQPSGGFVDVLFADGRIVSDFGKPPVWPWAARIVVERSDSLGHGPSRKWGAELQNAYDAFVRYERHWVEHRSQAGLFHYDTAAHVGDWEQEIRFESGWDDSVRWDHGIVNLWPSDLNAYMVLFYSAMEFLACRVGRSPSEWQSKREALRKHIEERLWDDKLGAYGDFDFQHGHFTAVLSPASFVPLFAGTASAERAARMAELARDPDHFFPGMPTVSYSHPDYSRTMWRGPCWLNTAYFALKGLQRYGHAKPADDIRETILNWCAKEGDLREYYDSRTGEGLAAVGFGWTAAFVLELILDWGTSAIRRSS